MLDFSVTFLITIINITILYFILRKILFKPVTKFMADRAQRVQDSIDQAERSNAEAAKLLAEYEEKHRKAEAEVREILQAAQKDAAALTQQMIADGKREAADIIAAARKQIEAEQKAVMEKFKVEAAALVIAASAKLAARDFSGDDNRHYAGMLLDELAAKNRGHG